MEMSALSSDNVTSPSSYREAAVSSKAARTSYNGSHEEHDGHCWNRLRREQMEMSALSSDNITGPRSYTEATVSSKAARTSYNGSHEEHCWNRLRREQMEMSALSSDNVTSPRSYREAAVSSEAARTSCNNDQVAVKEIGTEDRPTRFDWREHGFVTPVRDQKGCGCCFVISSVGSTECLVMTATGILVQLSIQQVIDCNLLGPNNGCYGGYAFEVFNFIANWGLTTEELYPFTSWDHDKNKKQQDVYQRFKKCKQVGLEKVVMIRDYKVVRNNPEALEKAILINPVVVTLWVNQEFRDYQGGILTINQFPPPTLRERDSPDAERHSVILVAFDNDKTGRRFWVGKNSWGEHWGEGGYFKLDRDVDHPWGVGGVTCHLGVYPMGYFRPKPSPRPPSFWESCLEMLRKVTSFNLNMTSKVCLLSPQRLSYHSPLLRTSIAHNLLSGYRI
jgi:hypothetical protein